MRLGFRRLDLAAIVAACVWAAIGGAGAADINVNNDITVSDTWTSDNTYFLTGVRFVRNGATLTIEPGTVVRGEPDVSRCSVTTSTLCAANSDCPGGEVCLADPGSLVVTRGSKIVAAGEKVKPIVFTNLDDDNTLPGSEPSPAGDYDDRADALSHEGEWGGLILLGRGYVANGTPAGPNPAKEVQIEGLQTRGVCSVADTPCQVNANCPPPQTCNLSLGLYGNCSASPLGLSGCDDDDSGTLTYASIRYGGFNLSAANEINGLTLGGVGRTTNLHHIEVFQNQDDGVEFFGGAASIKNLVVANPGDDSVDYDEGWRGKLQFVFVMQGIPGNEKSDKGGEHDGGISTDFSQPFAIPTIYNATYVGLGGNGPTDPNATDPAKAYTGKAINTNLHFRDAAGGRYYNSFFADWGGTTVLLENTCQARTTTAYTPNTGNCSVTTATTCAANSDCPGGEVCVLHYRGPDSEFQWEMRDNAFWCFGNGSTVPTLQTDAVAAGGDALPHIDPGIFTTPAWNNDYHACTAAMPIRLLTRAFNPIGTQPNPISVIDPRPTAGSVLLSTPRTPPNDGFFEPAPYQGAFDSTNWAEGWTATSMLGYFPAKPIVNVNADITTSTLWTHDNEYNLTGVRFVRNGATLTIEPGTVVRGEPDVSRCSVTTTTLCTANSDCPGGEICLADPGALVIARGSKIQAAGEEDKPIIFTNLDDDNIGAVLGSESSDYRTLGGALAHEGEWGGVILLGRGYVSNGTPAGPNPTKEIQIEGLQTRGVCSVADTPCQVNANCPPPQTCNLSLGLYGNCSASPLAPAACDDDDSGTLTYASIRYGGFNLSAANEINGLTLGGVGRTTNLHHIEVFQNQDDGVEFFGGAASIKNLVVANPGDDSVDYDEGWRGKLQYVFVMQGIPGNEKSDKGGEHDGGISTDFSQPFAIPTIYNATYVGLGGNAPTDPNATDPARAYTGKAINTNLHFRDAAGGRYYNSFFADWGGTTVLLENTCQDRTTTAYTPNTGNCSVTTATTCAANSDCPGGEVCVLHYRNPDSEFQWEMRDNAFWCFGNGSTVPTLQTDAVAAGGDALPHIDPGIFTTPAWNNDYHACTAAMPIRLLTRAFNPIGTQPHPIGSIDPRPTAGSVLLSTPRTTPNDGFFEPASHQGAFRGTNWAEQWTGLSRLGYFPSCAGGSGVGPAPYEVARVGFPIPGDRTYVSWNPVTPSGQMGVVLYDLVRKSGTTAAAASNANPGTCLEMSEGNTYAVDPQVPAVGEIFFYIPRAVNDCADGTLGFGRVGATSPFGSVARTRASCP